MTHTLLYQVPNVPTSARSGDTPHGCEGLLRQGRRIEGLSAIEMVRVPPQQLKETLNANPHH